MLISFSPGLYLSGPIVRKMQGGKTFHGIMVMASFAFPFYIMIEPLQSVMRATIQVDRHAAMEELAKTEKHQVFFACARHGTSSYEQCDDASKRAARAVLERYDGKGL